MELRIFGWVSLNHETRHGSPKSQSFLENIPFVYGGRKPGSLNCPFNALLETPST